MKPINSILLFSNPFGYGPTTTLLHIAEELAKRTSLPLLAAGKRDGLCGEIFTTSSHPSVVWHDLDERDYGQVKTFIAHHPNTAVISILNRFCIQAAHELKVPNALVDFLAWFWDTPAAEYGFADLYFTNKLGMQLPIVNAHTYDVPIILGPIPRRTHSTDPLILINIGGSQNPLVEGIPTDYLTLFSEIINRLDFGSSSDVYIAGGRAATDFVNQRLHNKTYHVGPLAHEKFLALHARADRFISLTGTNATFMSFALQVPTIFLLPQLLAHWKLSLLLQNAGITDVLMWENYYQIDRKTYTLSEKELVPLTESLSRQTLNNNIKLSSIVTTVQNWLATAPNLMEQDRFIRQVGVNGEKELVSRLISEWNLPT